MLCSCIFLYNKYNVGYPWVHYALSLQIPLPAADRSRHLSSYEVSIKSDTQLEQRDIVSTYFKPTSLFMKFRCHYRHIGTIRRWSTFLLDPIHRKNGTMHIILGGRRRRRHSNEG